MVIKQFTMAHYDAAYELWQSTKGVCKCKKCVFFDSLEQMQLFLFRNPKTCFIAEDEGKLVGTVLAGHDGRTGIMYRLTIAEDFKRKGIGKSLVKKAVKALKNEGIQTVKAFVLNDNEAGNSFWNSMGFGESEKAVTLKLEIE